MSSKLCKVVSYAKLSWRKYSNLYIDLGLPVRAVKASVLPSRLPLRGLFTSQLSLRINTQLKRPMPTAKARFVCWKERYVHCNILCFKPDRKEYIGNTSQNSFRGRPWVSGIYLRISPVFRVFRGVNAMALELVLNALPLLLIIFFYRLTYKLNFWLIALKTHSITKE